MGSPGGWVCRGFFFCHSLFLALFFHGSFLLTHFLCSGMNSSMGCSPLGSVAALVWLIHWPQPPQRHTSSCVSFCVSCMSFFCVSCPSWYHPFLNMPEETEPWAALTGYSVGTRWTGAAHLGGGWTQLSPAQGTPWSPTQGTLQPPATQILPDMPMTHIESTYKSFSHVSKYLFEKLIILTPSPHPSFQLSLVSLPFLCHCQQHFHPYSYWAILWSLF